jgi:hypothetical protein
MHACMGCSTTVQECMHGAQQSVRTHACSAAECANISIGHREVKRRLGRARQGIAKNARQGKASLGKARGDKA